MKRLSLAAVRAQRFNAFKAARLEATLEAKLEVLVAEAIAKAELTFVAPLIPVKPCEVSLPRWTEAELKLFCRTTKKG